MKKSKFIEIIKKLIERERKLKEASTTVTAGGSYMTPNAFSKKKEGHKDPEEGGYKKVNEAISAKGWNMSKKFIPILAKEVKNLQKYHRTQNEEDFLEVANYMELQLKYMKKNLNESINEGKYHDYRNDETLTPRQKIGHSMREVRNALSELNKLIEMNVRLKNELNVDSRSYWKNTHKALGKISERLVKLANKVGKLQ